MTRFQKYKISSKQFINVYAVMLFYQQLYISFPQLYYQENVIIIIGNISVL